MQIEINQDELKQAVMDYVKAKGMQLPPNARTILQCYGPDVRNVGGITAITAKVVLAEQETLPPAEPTIPPVTVPTTPAA